VWREGERQQHKLKHGRLRLEIRSSLFPRRTAQQWSWGPGEAEMSLACRASHPDCEKPSEAWCDPPPQLILLWAVAGTGDVPRYLPAYDSC